MKSLKQSDVFIIVVISHRFIMRGAAASPSNLMVGSSSIHHRTDYGHE